MLDEMVNLDEERLAILDVLIIQKERVSKAYNKKAKVKTLSIRDLVWKVILPINKRDRNLGKFSPNWEGPFRIIHVFLIMLMKLKS